MGAEKTLGPTRQSTFTAQMSFSSMVFSTEYESIKLVELHSENVKSLQKYYLNQQQNETIQCGQSGVFFWFHWKVLVKLDSPPDKYRHHW